MDLEDKKFTIKASVFGGLVVACPLLAYQIVLETNGIIWAFVSSIIVAIILIFSFKNKILKD